MSTPTATPPLSLPASISSPSLTAEVTLTSPSGTTAPAVPPPSSAPQSLSRDLPRARPLRKGRGSNRATNRTLGQSTLLKRHELFSPACSASTQKNINRVKATFPAYARKHGAQDPTKVNGNSSLLVLNFLSEYCDMGGAPMLKNDSMGGVVQGLRHLYEQHGHFQAWNVDEGTGIACGNPLVGNPDLVRLRRAHRVILAKKGQLSLKARPVTVAHVCEHAERFWFGSDGNRGKIDVRDIELHAVLVVGLNMGMRFDEVAKLTMEHVSLGSGALQLTLTEAIKNSTEQRTYTLRDWPGNTALRFSVFMDPFLALTSWMVVRGSSAGPLFCDYRQTRAVTTLDVSKPWSATKFKNFLRGRLNKCGIGKGDLEMYSGHSIKRGAVQLYRSLGLRDEYIMEIVQMKGENAYANYTACYNDCAPEDLPRFANKRDFLAHADKISVEHDSIQNEKDYENFVRSILGGASL